MDMKNSVSPQLRKLNILMVRAFDTAVIQHVDPELTSVQARTIVFIAYASKTHAVFQRDVQEAFAIRRSSASLLLNNMEANGLITRESVHGDARLKKLVLTKRAIELSDRIINQLAAVEEQLVHNISPEDIQHFLTICRQLTSNLTNMTCPAAQPEA